MYCTIIIYLNETMKKIKIAQKRQSEISSNSVQGRYKAPGCSHVYIQEKFSGELIAVADGALPLIPLS